MKFAGMMLMILGMAQFALATQVVPEIDGSTLSTGITLAAGALLVMRGRKK